MNRILIRYSLCIFSVVYVFSGIFSQEHKLIDSKALKKDFKQFLLFLDAHPDPYQKIDSVLFNNYCEDVRSSLDQEITELEFYRKLSSIVALIRDGHSSVYMPKDWLTEQRKEWGAFPCDVHLTNDDELFIINNYGADSIPPGAKVISINGIRVDSFLNRIDPFISYEIKPFRNTKIDGGFEFYLYLAFDRSKDTRIEYSFIDTSFVSVKNLDFREWKKHQKNDREERERKIASGKPYEYNPLPGGVGHLIIYAFSTPDINNYRRFLRRTFTKIRNDSVHSLIIDVRGNFGGWPKISSEVFHYITNQHFKTQARSSMKISHAYRKIYTDANPWLKNANTGSMIQRRHYLDLNAILSGKLGSYVDEEVFFNEKPEHMDYEFEGDVYLLANRDSYSAASSFAATFKCYQMGKIIGEETGGTKIFRANPIVKKLNKSRLFVRSSTTKLFNTCYFEEDQGVRPDIYFTPSILDIVNDSDSHLRYAQFVIKKSRLKQSKMQSK